jgi:hypothetical protein
LARAAAAFFNGGAAGAFAAAAFFAGGLAAMRFGGFAGFADFAGLAAWRAAPGRADLARFVSGRRLAAFFLALIP